MATEVVTRPSLPVRMLGFFRDVRGELERVTWPDKDQVVRLSLVVVGFAVLIGLVIAAMDLILQGLLMRLIPSLLGRG
jgi:preprotein translocase subunit SecE